MINNFTSNVLTGSETMRKFFCPRNYPAIPLLEMTGKLNPFSKHGVRILFYPGYMTPLGTLKGIAAYNLISEARRSGILEGVHTIVESTSGAMGLALAPIARAFGVPNTLLVVRSDIAPGRLESFRLNRIEYKLQTEEEGGTSAIEVARQMGEQLGFYNPWQYGNEANSSAYKKWFAPVIWKETRGKMTIFCAPLGTTGLTCGSSDYLKSVNPKVKIIAAYLAPGDGIPGARNLKRLKEVGLDWRSKIDASFSITTKQSFAASLEAMREGIPGCPSFGLARAGLSAFLQKNLEDNTLDDLRNADGEVVAVIPCHESYLSVQEKYATHLNSSVI